MVSMSSQHSYSHLPLDAQRARQNVRVVELDFHLYSGELSVYPLGKIDSGTTCTNMAACLQIIKRWSDADPCHTPVVVWIEPKDDWGEGGDTISIADLLSVDRLITKTFGRDRVITPADATGTAPNLKKAIAMHRIEPQGYDVSGWPTLAQAR